MARLVWPASSCTSRRLPPTWETVRAARVMKVRRPECDEQPSILSEVESQWNHKRTVAGESPHPVPSTGSTARGWPYPRARSATCPALPGGRDAGEWCDRPSSPYWRGSVHVSLSRLNHGQPGAQTDPEVMQG